MDPPEFAGGLDPVLAHDWLAGMERFFQAIQCNEEEKAVYAPDELWKIDQFLMENSLKRVQEERNQNRTNFWEQGKSAQHLKPRNPPSKKKQGYGDHSNYPPQCDKCKRRHHGECKPYSVTCFECGEPGHVIKNCPKKKTQEKTAGRVYTLDVKKAKGNNNLIAGTCYVNNQPLCVLVDYGATHSFISTECAYRLSLEFTPLPDPMVISSATGDTVEARLICKYCSVSFNGRDFPIDLICLPLKRLDVILRMDWLSPNSMYIGCKQKAIFIPA
ncbi:uncharacterized protein LOC131604479 [Vicia villosa]|uniref:uncharacterized protein LOC131604479 n=1 Tax=Vicia villosa TaxID=3911 RepID=UPI00273C3636|nr:uncharacterized protein LOC131604479 [Vicia villosa]